MPVLEGPAYASPFGGPAHVVVSAGVLPDQPPPAPPVPVSWVEPVVSEPPLVQVLIRRAITRDVIGELTTADADDWDRDVELLAGYTASITASSTDPLWQAVASSSAMGGDGRMKYEFDPKGFVVEIYEDGFCVWTGVCHQPVDIGGGRVMLPAQGPQEVLNGRILGRAEQEDYLEDRGSFEVYASVAAMEANGWDLQGVEAQIVNDGVRGTKCLRVRGLGSHDGWVRSPRVTLVGADGIGKAVSGSAFGKWDITIPADAVVIKTYAQRTDSLAPSNPLVTDEASGVRPDDQDGWTDMPVLSGGRMSAQAVPHRCWVEIKSFDGVWSYYDLVTLRQSIQTGFPPGVKADLSLYIDRIHASLTSLSRGGSPTGLTVRLMSLTGTEESMRWSHEDRAPVTEVVGQVLNMDGAPECRITTGWVLEVHDRLGAERPDVVLSASEVIDPKWTIDPKARINDFVVDTGRGEGVAWIASTVSTPAAVAADEWRTLAVVQGPTDRTLNEIDSWTRARARAAACLQVTAEASVPRDLAAQISVGDVPFVFLEDGDLGSPRRMRVLRVRDMPKAGLAVLSLGAVDA